MERGARGARARPPRPPPSAGLPVRGARPVTGSSGRPRPAPSRCRGCRKLRLSSRPGSGAPKPASGKRLPLLDYWQQDAGGRRSLGAAMGAERGGDAATAAAEAGGLLLAGAEAAAAGEARDWWSRGQSEGPGMKKRLAVATGTRASARALRPLRVLPTCGVGGWRVWEDERPECRMTRGRGRAANLGSGTVRGKSLRAARPLRPEHLSVSRVGPRGPLTEDSRQDGDSRSTKTTLAPYLALAWAQTPGASARFSFLTLPHNCLGELTKPWVPGPHPKGSDGGSLAFRLRSPFLNRFGTLEEEERSLFAR
ncbi:uncharacterized protein [Physeter macrocephalus]|uniref:Uncharacterized protein n=1 Tax=Physeter macrocephalus TaxID=9755 RepID=A0A455CBB1_PHYMC|nr:uncharacterized protein LOC114487853 [Physeter catodon]|eukprot:XP_028356121.1 uncharacterized protein LOC114487853 [Physeter catodon]